mgnify:CR=1 FL=1
MDYYAIDLHPDRVEGLTLDERANLVKLMEVYHSHISKNAEKNKYYEGHVTLGQVNLGIALPSGMRGLEVGCAWGAKTVDVLAARSMFDGYVGQNGEPVDELREIVQEILGNMDGRISIHDFRMVQGKDNTNLIFDIALPAELMQQQKTIKKHCFILSNRW